jgi:alkyldihydroxyacetonephosphate synthase
MRERSFWGWGWADRFPDDDTRRGMGEHARAVLGLDTLELLAPPTLDSVRLPPSRIAPPESLASFTSGDRLARVTHTYGRAYRDLVRGFRGDFSNAPDLVATPRTEAEVEAVLDWAAREEVKVIPFGGGTSVVGGVEAAFREQARAVVSLDLRGLERVLEVDPISRAARIQAGATGPVLEEQLAAHGFTLRHFPQSFEFSTLGGWIATRAGGHFATLYTHIDDLVESTRMLTPSGVMESRRLPGSGAGPSPDRLVLGSEGTLGVITEAWMHLQRRPRWRSTASVHFEDYRQAVEATRAVAQAGLYPTNCRLLDPEEARLNMVAFDGTAVLILGFESADHPLEPWLARALAICEGLGGTCPKGPVHRDGGEKAGGDAAASWKQAFIDAPYLQNVLVSLGVVADTFETACTWDRFDRLHGEVTEAVRAAMQRVCGGGRISCRFTHVYPDGPAPYYTFVVPAKVGGELEQWAEIKQAASDALIRCGATITHHHAVGRTHRPWYDRQRPEPFAAVLKAAKSALDPKGILNPGVLVDA